MGVSIDSDQDIWRNVLAGQPRDFGQIWDRHRDRVLTHIARLGESHADAEDLTAVAFLELWRHREGVRFVDGSLLPWLLVTAHNAQRNAARSRRRYRAMLAKLPTPQESGAPEVADPRAALAAELLAECKGADQDLMLLTAIEGFTVAQAAHALGLTEPAARMRLSRLRTTIRSAATAAASMEGGAS